MIWWRRITQCPHHTLASKGFNRKDILLSFFTTFVFVLTLPNQNIWYAHPGNAICFCWTRGRRNNGVSNKKIKCSHKNGTEGLGGSAKTVWWRYSCRVVSLRRETPHSSSSFETHEWITCRCVRWAEARGSTSGEGIHSRAHFLKQGTEVRRNRECYALNARGVRYKRTWCLIVNTSPGLSDRRIQTRPNRCISKRERMPVTFPFTWTAHAFVAGCLTTGRCANKLKLLCLTECQTPPWWWACAECNKTHTKTLFQLRVPSFRIAASLDSLCWGIFECF